MSWSRGRVVLRRLGFNREKRALVKIYHVALKRGKVVHVHEDELKRDASRV